MRRVARWVDLPIDAHVIFFSHEWVGWNHPDSHGVQLKTFLRVMQRLGSGRFQKFKMVQLLLVMGARIDAETREGSSVLTALCANEDSDPRILREILRRSRELRERLHRKNHPCEAIIDVNYRVRSQTWI